MLDLIQKASSLLEQVAPQLARDPLPLFVVGGFIAANLALYMLTKGKEYPIVAASSLLFLFPFLKVVWG